MRPRRLLAFLPALTLSAALLAPAAAFATQTTTVHFTHTESRAEYNPCSGAPGTLTIMLSGVLHITDLGDGTVHRTTTTTGTVTFVPDDSSQASFSGHLAGSLSEITNPMNAIDTNAENVVAHGSDGSLGKQHILIHHTVNANGTVTSSIEIVEFTCLSGLPEVLHVTVVRRAACLGCWPESAPPGRQLLLSAVSGW